MAKSKSSKQRILTLRLDGEASEEIRARAKALGVRPTELLRRALVTTAPESLTVFAGPLMDVLSELGKRMAEENPVLAGAVARMRSHADDPHAEAHLAAQTLINFAPLMLKGEVWMKREVLKALDTVIDESEAKDYMPRIEGEILRQREDRRTLPSVGGHA